MVPGPGALHVRAAVLGVAGEVAGPPRCRFFVVVFVGQRVIEGLLRAEIIRRGVVLDVCPSSNLRTGAVHSWAEHPLRKLYDAGVLVTINSDDPTFFHTTITEEYRRSVTHFGFGADELTAMTLNAARATFLPPAERAALYTQINAGIVALRRELGV